MSDSRLLSPRDGYQRWAADYDRETVVSALDEALVSAMGIDARGKRLVDVGCGVGRRLQAAQASLAVGVDLTPEMLQRCDPRLPRCVATAERLPLADASFDVVWCRLMVGHLPTLATVYSELGRVCAPTGDIVVSDFHPAATRAGHRRTFRDADGTVHEIEHHLHEMADHHAAASAVGLEVVHAHDGVVDDSVRLFYESAGRLAAFHEQRGLPLVLALHLRRAT